MPEEVISIIQKFSKPYYTFENLQNCKKASHFLVYKPFIENSKNRLLRTVKNIGFNQNLEIGEIGYIISDSNFKDIYFYYIENYTEYSYNDFSFWIYLKRFEYLLHDTVWSHILIFIPRVASYRDNNLLEWNTPNIFRCGKYSKYNLLTWYYHYWDKDISDSKKIRSINEELTKFNLKHWE